ncbi:MAG: 2Fe-2S iron-sulfur cluster-binding protein, partial [Anaerolineaceae bacterium]|nr:2Fe-2S iron-sulfur cluster-binding protein [Anaerolineaceae bacterium]
MSRQHKVTFEPHSRSVHVETDTSIFEAARIAGINIPQPCGGQGRCGRCLVQVIGDEKGGGVER